MPGRWRAILHYRSWGMCLRCASRSLLTLSISHRLYGNKLADASGVALARALESNTALQTLQ